MSPRLETDGGDVLRMWRHSDAQAVVDAFDDPSMASQTNTPITNLSAAEEWIARQLEAGESGEAWSWAVTRGDTVVGCVALSSINRRHSTAWVSYWVTRACRGRGTASSALRAASEWAFEELGLHRLELGHRTNNPASCRVAHAAGFTVEGVEREKLRYGERRFDVELHARLRTDPAPPARV